MLYAVCTRCTFLRAYSRRARGMPTEERCPACGSELIVQRRAGRFEPTYVSRVTLDLHARPPLELGTEPPPETTAH